MMKIRLGILLALKISAGAAVASTSYSHFPTSFDGALLDSAQKNIDLWNEKRVALSGVVDRIENGYVGKPYFQVRLTENNPNGKKIWIGSLITPKMKIGDELRILGFFSKNNNDSLAQKYNKDKFHILGFCVVNVTTKHAYYLPNSNRECSEWQNGIIRENK